jgi:PAS domain S-box-containing protein
MDIRTKLVFALVAVALGSMMALGLFLSPDTTNQLGGGRVEHLESLAESKKEGLVQIEEGWRDRIRLISSRTALRQILMDRNLRESPEGRERIDRILSDANGAEPSVESLALYDAQGRLVGSAGWGTESDLQEQLDYLLAPEDDVIYQGVQSPEDENFRIAYAAALTSERAGEGELVGILQVRLNPRPLVDLTRRREMMGASGEVQIAIRDTAGAVRVLRRSTPGARPVWEPVELRGESDPVALAMNGTVDTYTEDVVDHRGKPVWAVTKFFEENGWGLVVTIDAEEARKPVEEFSSKLIDVTISLGAFAILIGTILGLRFAKPIHELAETAEKIKDGDLSVRAPVATRDEVGLLARNFNQMADELEQQVTLLKEFQNYFDYSRDMLCIAGTDGYFKRVNPAFERVLGWTREELLTRQFLDFVHPDDLEKTQQEINRLAQGLPTISFQNRYMCQDGTEKILAWTAHPQPDTGVIYAIARDVTEVEQERKYAEEMIQGLLARLRAAEAKRGDDP